MRGKTLEPLALLLFAVGILASLPFVVHPWYDRTNDGSTYILTARAIAAGEGYTYLGAPFIIRPPGFALLVGLFAGGKGETDFAGLNWMVSVFGALGVVLLYRLLRAHLEWPLAMLTGLALWLNPGYQRLCNQVMSDVPGLALVLACLLLERWASHAPSFRRELLLGASIGLAAYVRSLAILLLPAIVAARLVGQLRDNDARCPWLPFVLGRVLIVVVVAWLVLLPWNVTRRSHAPPPPADQTLNYSLSTAMWREDPGDPRSPRVSLAEILARVPQHLHDAALVVGSRMQYRIPGDPRPGPGAARARLLVASLLGLSLFVVLWRRGRAGEWYACGALLVIAVYFVFTDRLALPVFVFALAATVEFARDLLRRVAGVRAAPLVVGGALVALIAVDFAPHQDWERIAAEHREFEALASAVNGAVPAEARLAAGQGFHYGVYLRRPVYSLMHAVRRAGRLEAAEPIIDKYGIDTVVLSPLVPEDRVLLPYFEERYGPGTPAGSATIWRVRGDGPPLARAVGGK